MVVAKPGRVGLARARRDGPSRRSRSASASSSSSRIRRWPTACGRPAAWRRKRPSGAGRRPRWRASSSSSPSWPRRAIVARPDLQFTRVVNGFSAVADPSAVVLLERSPRVAGVFPVRAAFPAATAADARTPPRPLAGRPRRVPGNGDHRGAARHGRGSRDAVSPRPRAARASTSSTAARLPATTRSPEATGWRRTARRWRASSPASAVPAAPAGIAPDVTVLPIRVAGWQRDAAGSWSIYGRTDQLIAGLERAVDPEPERRRARCGAHHADPAVRAVLGVPGQPAVRRPSPERSRSTRSSSFPRGTTGPAGQASARSAARAGAPEALTAGAADLQAGDWRASRCPFRAGLRVLLHRPLELLTSIGAGRRRELRSRPSCGKPANLFDRKGKSRVAGRAALLARGLDTAARGRAGGGSRRRGRGSRRGRASRRRAGARSRDSPCRCCRHPASLSAARSRGRARRSATVALHRRGLDAGAAHAGSVAGGVLLLGIRLRRAREARRRRVRRRRRRRASPGADGDGFSRFVTVSGTSVAAAVVAGTAARLAHARPSLDAAGLRSALATTARPARPCASLAAQGTGVVDAARAAVAELVADRASMSFGRGAGRRLARTSNAVAPQRVQPPADGRRCGRVPAAGASSLRLQPKRLRISAGGTGAHTRERARVGGRESRRRERRRPHRAAREPAARRALVGPPRAAARRPDRRRRALRAQLLALRPDAGGALDAARHDRARTRAGRAPARAAARRLAARRTTVRCSGCWPGFATSCPGSTPSGSRAAGRTARAWSRGRTGCGSSPGLRPAGRPHGAPCASRWNSLWPPETRSRSARVHARRTGNASSREPLRDRAAAAPARGGDLRHRPEPHQRPLASARRPSPCRSRRGWTTARSRPSRAFASPTTSRAARPRAAFATTRTSRSTRCGRSPCG